ncbi:hypothetical protein [Roseivirga seohaensis]|uniref:hypothetical protein n=1 Tax=Roseivirga seohaensis TaxID=1914963 RepID=UPI003BAC41A7
MSKAKQPFSFSFMSYSRQSQKSHGIVTVDAGRLLFKKKTEDPEEDALQDYVDTITGEAKKFYVPALMSFNGKKLTLK